MPVSAAPNPTVSTAAQRKNKSSWAGLRFHIWWSLLWAAAAAKPPDT